MQYNTIFSQLFHFIPGHRFEKKVKEMNGDRYCKDFTAWIQFLNPLYAIDSTTVDMCLGMYSWAKYKTTKGAIKLHT